MTHVHILLGPQLGLWIYQNRSVPKLLECVKKGERKLLSLSLSLSLSLTY